MINITIHQDGEHIRINNVDYFIKAGEWQVDTLVNLTLSFDKAIPSEKELRKMYSDFERQPFEKFNSLGGK